MKKIRVCMVTELVRPALGGGGLRGYRYMQQLRGRGGLAFVLGCDRAQARENFEDDLRTKLLAHKCLTVPRAYSSRRVKAPASRITKVNRFTLSQISRLVCLIVWKLLGIGSNSTSCIALE